MPRLANLLFASTTPSYLPSHLTSYVPGKTPLSTWPVVFTTLVSYLTVVFGIRVLMKDRSPLKLNTLFRIHNLFLSAGSLVLLVLMLEEVVLVWWKSGTYSVMCADSSWTDRLEFYYMINYYFKYVELLDTFFLALKKKPLAFLHVFHHSATALLCFTQLNGKTSISWVVITLNLSVHVIMYYYYYATAGGAKIWWKKYLTTIQIVQFVIDLFIVYFGTYQHYAFTRAPHLPHIGNCAGTESAALFGCGLLSSYLILFINFYIQTYKRPAMPSSSRGNGTVNRDSYHTMNGNGHKLD